ncbi:hypothetical protein GCM10010282_18020 [Streptomyces roseolus]|nr:hypothetical protein GCM10010282_18020 [Streptomyces roseolus]
MASRESAGPPPTPSQDDQLPPGAVCQRWNTPLVLDANTSTRPSALAPAASRCPPVPKLAQPDQPALGAVCHMWSKVASESANSSSRPSALAARASCASRGPPLNCQGDQPPFTSVCQEWYTPSAPAAKASSRPSADRADTTRPEPWGCAVRVAASSTMLR